MRRIVPRGLRTAGSFLSLSCWLVVPEVASAGTPTPFAPPGPGTVVVYRNATLIDGTAAPARPSMDVAVDGQRITAVLPHKEVPSALLLGARTVDLTGRFLLPGLIDSHVHLATPPNRRQAEAMLRRDLYGGVTAVRDMADDLRSLGDITRASLVGEVEGSDVFYAALMAGPSFFSDPRTVAVTAGAMPGQVPWVQAVTDKTDLPLAVAMARGTYATAIKLYGDLSPELAAKIVTEAHRQHMPVWAHSTLFPAKPSDVVRAGVDAISHACLLVHEASHHILSVADHESVPVEQFAAGRSPLLDAVFLEMVKRGTILDATVWTFDVNEVQPTPPPGRAKCDGPIGAAITSQAYRDGVMISAGTDNVAPWNDAWPDLFHELHWLVQGAKMPPSAVIQSATLIGARAAGQEREMGSIAVGKLANMVVLGRNPLEDIDNLKSIELVIKRGRAYQRSAFKPLLEADITDE
jgi:imidazolonepropionase-like amidohydrolase